MAFEKDIPTVSVDEEGKPVFHLGSDALNGDWIRGARVVKEAEEGSEKAKAKLKELNQTPMKGVIFGKDE